MVRGRGIAVSAVACTYQCADTTRIARGRGTDSPKARQASVYLFFSSAFIGLPWPKNAAGITVIADLPLRRPLGSSPRELEDARVPQEVSRRCSPQAPAGAPGGASARRRHP